ncbi:MAG TPA: hypothetical protein VFV34_18190, partial [Blastocatellia bacterium]|nr:hypothetical protein [Blastocatellia bacterium]
IFNPASVTNSCSGTVQAIPGLGTISFSGGTVAAGGSCTITVNITGTTPGVKNNTTSAITSANGGTGTTSNTATITVLAPPTIQKAFSSTNVTLNVPITLTFTITNPNLTDALTGVGFTDNFPPGLVVATPPNATNPCGGSFTPVAGASSVSLSGMTVPAGATCTLTVSVVVTNTTPPVKNNTVSVTSANGGTSATSSTATLTTFDVCIYDPTNKRLLQYSSVSGAWQFTDCAKGGAPVTGTGLAEALPGGCKLKLTVPNPSSPVKTPGVTITATANTCTGVGTATVTINGVTYNLTDPNINDGTCSCPLP